MKETYIHYMAFFQLYKLEMWSYQTLHLKKNMRLVFKKEKRGSNWIRTHCHHVVPSVQQTHTKLQSIGSGAHIYERKVSVQVLTDSRCPGHKKPTDNEENDTQQSQDAPAGHVGNSLCCARQEHL